MLARRPFSINLAPAALRWLTIAVVVYAASVVAAFFILPTGSAVTIALLVSLYLVAAGFSIAAMGYAIRKSTGLYRGLWISLAIGVGLRVLGDLGWAAFANLRLPQIETTAYQTAWACSFIALFFGLLLFIARVNRRVALLTALDTVAVVFSVALLSFYLLVDPVVGDGGGFVLSIREPSPDPQLPRRPAADAALLFVSLVILSAERKPPSAGLIVVAFGSLLAADGWLLRLYAGNETYDPTHPLGMFWLLALLLFGLAALSSASPASSETTRAGAGVRATESAAHAPDGVGSVDGQQEDHPLRAVAFWFGPLSPAMLYIVALVWAMFDRPIPSYLLLCGIILLIYLALRLSILGYVNRALVIDRQEEARRLERARIATELDEALERTVHSIPPMLDSYIEVRENSPQAADAALRQSMAAAREASYRIAYPVRELRTRGGDTTLGPDYLVEQLIEEVETNFEIRIHRYIGASPAILTTAELGGTYRVVSEALWNAAKHSGARNIWVSTRWVGSMFLVKVRDDGDGFATEKVREGYGFSLMRSRAREIGAGLDIISRPTGGTTVQLRFDLVNRLREGSRRP